MTWVVLLLITFPLWGIPALWLLFPLAIQYERGGVWLCVAPVTLLALLLDVVLNYTTLALLTWDFPRWGEWTFSTRLARLIQFPDEGYQRYWSRYVARCLDAIAPSGQHIKRPVTT